MFLEKHSRFIRQYDFRFAPRHNAAALMPLTADKDDFSVVHALRKRLQNKKAFIKMANNDIIELIKVEVDPARKAVVLLFHRGSPDAADPTYRKRVDDEIKLRLGEKDADEEQSVSAHLIIAMKPKKPGVYTGILEEIPGLSMGVLQPIIGQALSEYPYQYTDKHGEAQTTYCVAKPSGVKSESVEDALNTGKMKFLTLVRPYKANYIDDDDRLEPEDEKLRIKIKAGTKGVDWLNMFDALIASARDDGWEEFKVDIDLGNDRSRQVAVGRDQDAKEVLFIKSEQINVKDALPVCSASVRYDFADQAIGKLGGFL